ncbi:hypothetical protein FHS83_003252 [Rhizomicrobium palustre]|uniref:DUF192 domain-containing protein n=1 Tax=Rhizomicrobium palustre TaxID=189966 RepID=A0A846N1T2_9PROT|nr:DUF192 domain-containing protein [Rhizomicrobium palustre]NIK89934.1 hypothetical protein [Rhizomicrobium palustre]
MRRYILAALLLLCGCSQGAGGTPQTGLPRDHIVVDGRNGPAAFDVQMATTNDTRAKGLMFVTALGKHEGMLFDYGKEQPVAFWMKNTVISLDMIFIKADGTISTIAENAIPYSEAPVPSSEPVRAVLEIPGGEARAQGIEAGGKVHAKIFGNAPSP